MSSGVYYEIDGGYDLYKSDITTSVDGSQQMANAKYRARVLSAGVAVGKKISWDNGVLFDSNAKFRYRYFASNSFGTSNGLSVYQGDYSSFGLVGSALLGKYIDGGKTLMYVKGELGEYRNNADSKTRVDDGVKSYYFENPDYDFYYANAIVGVKHRVADKLELSLEANRYIMQGSSDKDFGVRAEFRYLF